MTVITRRVESPIGDLLLVGAGERLQGLYMPGHRWAPSLHAAQEDGGAFGEAVRQLGEWFHGRRQAFDLAVDRRGTAFQLRVWDVLLEIPFAETVTYGEVAARAGRPGSARAAGHAVARNPLSIVFPCHRVIGVAGGLTGYAGGLEAKRWLLEHERAQAASALSSSPTAHTSGATSGRRRRH